MPHEAPGSPTRPFRGQVVRSFPQPVSGPKASEADSTDTLKPKDPRRGQVPQHPSPPIVQRYDAEFDESSSDPVREAHSDECKDRRCAEPNEKGPNPDLPKIADLGAEPNRSDCHCD